MRETKKKSPGDGALDGSAAEKEGISFPSHPTTSLWRSDRPCTEVDKERKLNPSALSAKRALGCGGVEDLHRDLLRTLLHGASRGKGQTQCSASRTRSGGHGIGRLHWDGPGGRAPGSLASGSRPHS